MLRFALQNLLSRPLRTLLAVLGLTVAIAGMVGLFSIAGGIDRLVNLTFEQIPGLLVQQRGAPIPLFSALPAEWGPELAKIPGVRLVNPEVLARVNLIEDESIISPPRFLLGVDIPSRLQLVHPVYNDKVREGGRFLVPSDAGTRHAVISRQVADEFEVEVGDPLRVNGYELTIVGVYHTGSILIDGNILLDIGTVREMTRIDSATVSSFYLEQDGTVPDEELAEAIERHFADRDLRRWQPNLLQKMLIEAFAPPVSQGPDGAAGRSDEADVRKTTVESGEAAAESPHPRPLSQGERGGASEGAREGGGERERGEPRREKQSPVEVRTQEDWAEKFDDFSADLNLFLTIMTGVGLLIAIFSIVNTLLMSVTERMIEFGILRANGWTRRDILRLIAFESALLGIAGGVAGAIVGWIAVQGINAWQPERLHLYAGPGLLAFSLAFSTVLGILGGVYPAWRAAKKPPMEAIRRI